MTPDLAGWLAGWLSGMRAGWLAGRLPRMGVQPLARWAGSDVWPSDPKCSSASTCTHSQVHVLQCGMCTFRMFVDPRTLTHDGFQLLLSL